MKETAEDYDIAFFQSRDIKKISITTTFDLMKKQKAKMTVIINEFMSRLDVNEVRYSIVPRVCQCNGQKVKMYGIKGVNILSGKKNVDIPDVFDSPGQALKFVELVNHHYLEIHNIQDVLYDFIG